MQLAESRTDTQAIKGGRKCSVCSHESLTAINSLLCTATLSNRRIATQFGFSSRAVDHHALHHLPAVIAKAAERKQIKGEDELLDAVRANIKAGAKGIEFGLSRMAEIDPVTAYRMVPAFMTAQKGSAELLARVEGRLAEGSTESKQPFVIVIGIQGQQPAIEADDDQNTIDVKAITS